MAASRVILAAWTTLPYSMRASRCAFANFFCAAAAASG